MRSLAVAVVAFLVEVNRLQVTVAFHIRDVHIWQIADPLGLQQPRDRLLHAFAQGSSYFGPLVGHQDDLRVVPSLLIEILSGTVGQLHRFEGVAENDHSLGSEQRRDSSWKTLLRLALPEGSLRFNCLRKRTPASLGEKQKSSKHRLRKSGQSKQTSLLR